MKKSFAQIDIDNGGNYIKLLSAVAKLSALFSESSIPFINYRVAENIFCRSFNAINLSRSDTAFDANYNNIGIGVKTFTSPHNKSREKIAEFNSLSNDLKQFKGIKLALKLAEFRNNRIDLAKRLYNIDSSLYHIIARRENELVLFESDYEKIDINSINSVKQSSTSLKFEDSNNDYLYNFSKSTLFRNFSTPNNASSFPVDIIQDPYSLLLNLFEDNNFVASTNRLIKGINYVVLPLYGRNRTIYKKSGLNQWNASGRKRDINEIYIPIPIEIHNKYPNFFPNRDKSFFLTTPTKEVLSAKLCQENSKALMTNPNKALSDWLLRTALKLDEGELATINKLDELGFDSVIIIKEDESNYSIDVMKTYSYEKFMA